MVESAAHNVLAGDVRMATGTIVVTTMDRRAAIV